MFMLDDLIFFVLFRIGKCYEKMNNLEMVFQFYIKCVEEDLFLDKVWIVIIDYYFRKRNFQKVLYYIEKVLNIDNENVFYW